MLFASLQDGVIFCIFQASGGAANLKNAKKITPVLLSSCLLVFRSRHFEHHSFIFFFQVNVPHEAEEINMGVVLPGANSDDTVHQPAEYMDIRDIQSFELERDDIKFVRLLGSGNFGEVFKATLGNDTVAVKSLKGENIYTLKYFAFEGIALISAINPLGKINNNNK